VQHSSKAGAAAVVNVAVRVEVQQYVVAVVVAVCVRAAERAGAPRRYPARRLRGVPGRQDASGQNRSDLCAHTSAKPTTDDRHIALMPRDARRAAIRAAAMAFSSSPRRRTRAIRCQNAVTR